MMKKILIFLFGSLVLLFLFTACKNDKAELLYPPAACDTSDVKYSTTILPILRENCYRCHAGSTTVGPFNLDSYDAVSVRAASGQLWGAVAHLPGFVPMPKDADQLSACNLAQIRKWLDNGFPNN